MNDAIGEIYKTPALILDEKNTMAIIEEYLHELPPLKTYWDEKFTKRQMSVIAWKSGTKIVHYAQLLKQFFSPTLLADMKTGQHVIKLAR